MAKKADKEKLENGQSDSQSDIPNLKEINDIMPNTFIDDMDEDGNIIPKPEVIEPPLKTDILKQLNNDSDTALAALLDAEKTEKIMEQRKEDVYADHLDKRSTIRAESKQRMANQRSDGGKDRESSENDIILSTGQPHIRSPKPKIDHDRVRGRNDAGEPVKPYTNSPIATIEGMPVIFIAAKHIHDRKCDWDDNYRDGYQRFTESDHPMYHNAAYTRVIYKDHFKKGVDGFVVKTDEEIMLFKIK